MGLLTGTIISKILDKGLGIVDKFVTDKDKANELRSAITAQVLSQDNSEAEKLLDSKTKIIVAEATGKSWMQRNWRPSLMFVIMAIVANNYILFPYLSLFTVKAVMLELPLEMWQLLKIGVGGYVVGRSGEKMMENFKK